MRNAFLLMLLTLLIFSGCSREETPMETTPMIITEAVTEPQTQPTTVENVMETTVETVPETTMPMPEPEDSALVKVVDYIPDIHTELKYATEDNFTHQVIYDFQDAYLRYGTVKKLKAVQDSLREIGLSIKIWDGYRPVSAQFKLWEVCPDDTYVADPRTGYSNHNRGNAVDVTIVYPDGTELEMPTQFDDFSGRADRNYAEIDEIPAENARLLQRIMETYGFQGYYGEWWHFNDTVRYDVEKEFDLTE